MSRVVVAVSIDSSFVDKFMGFLKNLSAINGDKKHHIKVESVTIQNGDDEIVAYPKETPP